MSVGLSPFVDRLLVAYVAGKGYDTSADKRRGNRLREGLLVTERAKDTQDLADFGDARQWDDPLKLA